MNNFMKISLVLYFYYIIVSQINYLFNFIVCVGTGISNVTIIVLSSND